MGIGRLITKIARRVCQTMLAEDLNTHFPAQVVSYDGATNLCSVRSCIRRIRSDDPNHLTTVDLGVLDDVHVKQFGSGKCHLTVAPTEGSYGVMHVSDRCLDQWFDKGGIVDPGSVRMFDINDCFFDPGIYPGVVDGNNGQLPGGVATDGIEMRSRSGNTFVSVRVDGADNETIVIAREGLTLTIDNDEITVLNADKITFDTDKLVVNDESDAVALASKTKSIWTVLTVMLTAWTAPKAPDGGVAMAAAMLTAILNAPNYAPGVGSTVMKVDS